MKTRKGMREHKRCKKVEKGCECGGSGVCCGCKGRGCMSCGYSGECQACGGKRLEAIDKVSQMV